ncbi:uncharacterized protein VTP21DRAFT_7687 [Calcarisporiella thermophila]|uniref:uncharacterized protein n=1 Tax=Calcarisporiella thermophila TaxID=911321 RepID=UPI003742A6F8
MVRPKFHARSHVHINVNTDQFVGHRPSFPLSLLRKFSRIRHGTLRKSRTHNRAVVFTFAALFVLYLYFFSPWSRDKGSGDREMDLMAKIYPQDGAGQVTAVLLNWMRLKNLKEIVQHLCKYEMFKTIMIWNNNQNVHLTREMFAKHCPSKVEVYNSPGNMLFIARYMACSMASTPYCFFQDDDWLVKNLRSMYANFLRSPHLVHTDTNERVYSATWRWCFFDDAVNLHTCFSWVGTGAFVSRENVVRFMRLASETQMDPTEFAYGDMYFTTYMNQPPYQLENDLVELPQYKAFSAGDGWRRNEIYMHKGLTRLYDNLSRGTGVFQTQELSPTIYQRDVRSPCHNDRCLFLASKHSFPDVRLFRYNPSLNISESESLHERYHDSNDFFNSPYHFAVDGKDSTVWRTHENIAEGDYIGLDLLFPVPFPIIYRLLISQDKDYFSALVIETSQDGISWTIVGPPLPEVVCRELGPDAPARRSEKGWLWWKSTHIGKIFDCEFILQEPGYRFMRLRSTRDFDFPYAVHEFSFRAPEHI